MLGITPGTSYTFSIWAKVDALPIVSDDADGGALMRIEWHSDPEGASSQLYADKLSLGPLLTTDYQLFSVTAVAPVGAAHARATITHRHNSQTVFYDDASFAVPEPCTLGLSLLSAVGVALMGGKRRVR